MLSQLAAVNANSSQGITHPELRGPDRGTGRFSPLGITTSGCQGTIGQRIGRGARGWRMLEMSRSGNAKLGNGKLTLSCSG
ncbi:hypothetical protein H6G51_12295 [Limnothrix sp. FACHB-708]|nr:hypothetical protein [Limnothrix sp. FACHB-708]